MRFDSIEKVSLDLLKTFYVFVETGKVEETATKLRITQASVSLQLKKLEKDTGLSLFSNVGRKKILSSTARDLFQSIAPPFQELEQRLKEVSKIKTQKENLVVRIGFHPMLRRLAISQINSVGFLQARFGSSMTLKTAFQNGDLDAVVGFEPLSFANCAYRKVKKMEPYLVFHNQLCKNEKWVEVKKFLATRPYIEHDGLNFAVKTLTRSLGLRETHLNKVASCEDPSSLQNLITSYRGWGLDLDQSDLKSTSLSSLKIPEDVLAPLDIFINYTRHMKSKLPF